MRAHSQMLPESFCSLLVELKERVPPNCTWAIACGAALALNGLEYTPTDIDVFAPATDASRIWHALSGFREVFSLHQHTEGGINSLWGRYVENGIEIDIVGDFAIRKDNCEVAWDIGHPCWKNLKFVSVRHASIPVFRLEDLLILYLALPNEQTKLSKISCEMETRGPDLTYLHGLTSENAFLTRTVQEWIDPIGTLADRRFVVVSGLPGSGKSTLASKLAPLLGLPVIDKDEIMEQLFDSKGVGDSAWRRTLSRESDLILRRKSEASQGAILVSHWHFPGMSPESGTPSDWLVGLSNRIVNLHCECSVEVAAARFKQRKRHLGHLDTSKTGEQILASIQALAQFQSLNIGERVSADTTVELQLGDLVTRISRAFERSRDFVQ